MDHYYGRIVASSWACALALAACGGSGEDSVGADLVVIDRRIQALTAAQIDFVDGTYTGCTARSGNWSLRVAGAPTLTNAALSLIRGDSYMDCKLAITHIHTTDNVRRAASMPIDLAMSYGTARAFGSPIAYYANAALADADFDDAIAITLLFSDDPALASATTAATYAVTTTSVSPSSVRAPDYSISLATVNVTTDLQKRVVTVAGDAVLTAGSYAGDSFAVINGTVGSSYADIKTAYDGGSSSAITTMIAASSLLAVSDDLTNGIVRTIIVARTQEGVTSYQKFAITFNPPA